MDNWFSRYKFCQPLGQGGMGTVYLAEDRQKGNSLCVIKQLTNKYASQAEHKEAIRLFRREAEILQSLSHPGIVHVFDDFCSEDGRYFLVMDYVPGRNLEIMVKTGGPFSSEHVTWMAIQCCEVLEYLHGRNPPIIYRDLKPSNLMLTPEGRVVFVDFGIARVFMPQEAATKVISAGYSPPEQYAGRPETRSDLYALGATLSNLLTGKNPKPLTMCAPALMITNVHPDLDALIRALTQSNPNDRPASAEAVRFELYKIHKEYDPAFVIPEPKEPIAKGVKVGLQSETSKQRAFQRLSAQVIKIDPSITTDPHLMRITPKADAPESVPQSKIWKRVKEWMQIWMT